MTTLKNKTKNAEDKRSFKKNNNNNNAEDYFPTEIKIIKKDKF